MSAAYGPLHQMGSELLPVDAGPAVGLHTASAASA